MEWETVEGAHSGLGPPEEVRAESRREAVLAGRRKWQWTWRTGD